jgi:peptidoglycan/xylan/chitin deacetylase (PgdA/CDA1 family)
MPSPCLPVETDQRDASIDPPSGLKPSQVPMFVILGFDDNYRADGINWVVNTLLSGRKNADGSPAHATFLLVGGGATADGGVFVPEGGQSEQDVVDAWSNAFAAGHEIGNHSWDHSDGGGFIVSKWDTEVQMSSDKITQSIPRFAPCQITAWRFPYLSFNDDGFTSITNHGLLSDASVEFGYDYWDANQMPPAMAAQFPNGLSNTSPEYGKHFWWPFTLDHGFNNSFMDNKGVQKHPGLWEFPVYTWRWPDGGTIRHVVGLDFNTWTSAMSDKTIDFCTVLKGTLNERLAGNRTPLNAGMHSDLYSAHNMGADNAFGNTFDVRRAGLECFVNYALSQPDVRLVSFKETIAWLRHPRAIH